MISSRRSASRTRFDSYRRQRAAELAGEVSGDEPLETTDPRETHRNRPRTRSFVTLLARFWELLEDQRWRLVAALLLGSLATALKLAPPAATKFVIDYVLPGRPLPLDLPAWLPLTGSATGRLWLVVAFMVAVSAVATLLTVSARYFATVAKLLMQVSLRRRVFDHASRLPLHRVQEMKSGGTTSMLREDAGGVGELIFNMVYNPWRAVVQLVGGLAVLMWVDWRLLAFAVLLLPVVYWTHRLWIRRIRPLFRDIRRQRQRIDANTTEVFGGMRVVRGFSRQKTEAAQYLRENGFMARQEVHVWWKLRTIDILWEAIMPIASGALLLYGGWQVIEGNLTVGDLMMFLVYLAMLLEPIATLAGSATAFQNNLAGFDRILDILAEDTEMKSDRPGRPVRRRATAGRIELVGVGFRYPGSDDWVLRDVDLVAEPGQTVALVGPSGAGKSTLCNLIARFYDPTAGQVLLDGADLRTLDLDDYRRQFGIVDQDVFLFDGTIAENIAYGGRDVDRDDVRRAARMANAAEFVERLPKGYDTLIGERGVKLSGGQRQRLAIARAVVGDPSLFILDEATSNLDSESERLIQDQLVEVMRGRTSFVIAHRLSTIVGADQIVVMGHGRVLAVGNHEELLDTSDEYREMVRLQNLLGPATLEAVTAS